jgi:hypothetical protein
VRIAGRGTDDALLNAGVRLYEWQPTTLYAKTLSSMASGRRSDR